jgi:hypothetical protein
MSATPSRQSSRKRDAFTPSTSARPFRKPGICVSRCPGGWTCTPARLLAALETVWELVRDGDGSYLEPGCYVPVGGFQEALVDALADPASWKPDPPVAGQAPGYLKTFQEFWAAIVQRPDGTLNFAQIARELADYHDLIGRVSEVYSSVTGGRISKPNTLAAAVIAQAEDYTDEAVGTAIDDLIREIEDQDCGASSAAEIVTMIRQITGRAELRGEPVG